MGKKIVIFSSNEVLNDPRVYRTAKTLAALHADISVFCKLRDKNNTNLKLSEDLNLKIHRIRVRTHLRCYNSIKKKYSL